MHKKAEFVKLTGRQREIVAAIYDKSEHEALKILLEMVDAYYEKIRKKEKRSFRMMKRINTLQGLKSLRPFSDDLDALAEAGYLGKFVWNEMFTLDSIEILQPCRTYFDKETAVSKQNARSEKMEQKDFLEGLEDIYTGYAVGSKLMLEFNEEKDKPHYGIRAGMYYTQFARLATFMANKYNITSIKMIQTSHVYELLEYLRSKGFKDATLKGYITAVRQVYKDNSHLFTNEFVLPTNAAYEQYRENYSDNK